MCRLVRAPIVRGAVKLSLPSANALHGWKPRWGVRRLERTTGVARPTNTGAAFFERCTRIISEVEEANAAVKDLGSCPRGLLRVAAPYLLGQAFLPDLPYG
jgi:DNA-binding transcriptional LysR family regulator